MSEYDYLIINDELQACVDEMHQIIQGEHNRCYRNQSMIAQITNELKANAKGE